MNIILTYNLCMDVKKHIRTWRDNPIGFLVQASVAVSVFFWVIFFLGEVGLDKSSAIWAIFWLWPGSMGNIIRRPLGPFLQISLITRKTLTGFIKKFLAVGFGGAPLWRFGPPTIWSMAGGVLADLGLGRFRGPPVGGGSPFGVPV